MPYSLFWPGERQRPPEQGSRRVRLIRAHKTCSAKREASTSVSYPFVTKLPAGVRARRDRDHVQTHRPFSCRWATKQRREHVSNLSVPGSTKPGGGRQAIILYRPIKNLRAGIRRVDASALPRLCLRGTVGSTHEGRRQRVPTPFSEPRACVRLERFRSTIPCCRPSAHRHRR